MISLISIGTKLKVLSTVVTAAELVHVSGVA